MRCGTKVEGKARRHSSAVFAELARGSSDICLRLLRAVYNLINERLLIPIGY